MMLICSKMILYKIRLFTKKLALIYSDRDLLLILVFNNIALILQNLASAFKFFVKCMSQYHDGYEQLSSHVCASFFY